MLKRWFETPSASVVQICLGCFTATGPCVAHPAHGSGDYRVHTSALLLTYNGVADMAQWTRFIAFVQQSLASWKVKHWAATLEKTKEGKLHIHLMLQFVRAAKVVVSKFFFETLKPRADPNDLLGEGWCRKKVQESYDRAFFYVVAEKTSQVSRTTPTDQSWLAEGVGETC